MDSVYNLNETSNLKKARLVKELSVDHMAYLLETTWETYNDLEHFEDDLLDCITIKQLLILKQNLDVNLFDLFGINEDKTKERLSFDDVVSQLRKYLANHTLSVTQFEEIVGWGLVEECLEDSANFLRFNPRGFSEVCQLLELNWISILENNLGVLQP